MRVEHPARRAIFYRLPAELLEPGVSTADAQDVFEVSVNGGHVHASVYTPSGDPDEDEERMCAPETRVYYATELVELAVFHDTAVDLHNHPRALGLHEGRSA